MSPPAAIALPLTRSEIHEAMVDVYRAGPRAPGVDHCSFEQVFGAGPGSSAFVRTEGNLAHHRHAFRLSRTRAVEIVDRFSGRTRQIEIPPFRDRIMMRALANKVAKFLPRTRVDWGRPGIDARSSIVALAQEVRRHPPSLKPRMNPRICGDDAVLDALKTRRTVAPRTKPWVGLRTDVANAFGSLNWKAALESPTAKKHLPEDLRGALAAAYNFFSPTGLGVPLGLATSPAMLQLAMAEADEYLVSCGVPAWRFMDDLAALVPDAARAKKILEGIAARIAPYGLAVSEKKSSIRRGAVRWLGHLVRADGTIDLADETKLRLDVLNHMVEKQDLHALGQALAHFALAGRGKNFRSILRQIKQRWGKKLDLSCYNIRKIDHLEHAPVLPAGKSRRECPRTRTSNGTSNGEPGTKRSNYGHPSNSGRQGCECRGVASEHNSPAHRSDTEADRVEETPSRRSRHGGRREGIRTSPEMVDLLGGYKQLLKAADDFAFAIAKRHTELEGKVVFGSFPKSQQYARASQLWTQVLSIFEREGRLLSPAQEEAMLTKVMPVLRTAATLTVVDAPWVCQADPLQVILERIGGKSTQACKSELVAEREARKAGTKPSRPSLYARLFIPSFKSSRTADIAAERAERLRNIFRPDLRNKRNGNAEEIRVAAEFDGTRTPRSGAGVMKGDVDTQAARIEVKSTNGERYLVRLHQLDQLRCSGKLPVVVLRAHKRTEFAMVDKSWADRLGLEVVATRRSGARQQTLSISRRRYGRALAGKTKVIEFDLGEHGTWLLALPDTFEAELAVDTERPTVGKTGREVEAV